MPGASELIATCVLACVCSVVVVLVLSAMGLGEHAPIAAAVSAGTSAGVSSSLLAVKKKQSRAAGEGSRTPATHG